MSQTKTADITINPNDDTFELFLSVEGARTAEYYVYTRNDPGEYEDDDLVDKGTTEGDHQTQIALDKLGARVGILLVVNVPSTQQATTHTKTHCRQSDKMIKGSNLNSSKTDTGDGYHSFNYTIQR